MNISAWSIKNPIPIILFFLILTIAGSMSYTKLGINDNPEVDFPIIVVNISQPGAAPAELETDVTKKVEDSLVGITGLEHITSTVSDGVSVTTAEFKIGQPIDTALNDVRDSISKIRQTLPQDINEPSITHPNFSGEPFAAYALESDKRTIEELSYIVDNTIGRELLTVNGVSQVRRSGGIDREIRVELNPTRLKALGVTADQVNAQIKGLNINVPGGKAEAGNQEQTIRTLGSAKTFEQLKALQISLPNGQTARLDTLGVVTDSTTEIRQISTFDKKPVVSFSVVRAQGVSIVTAERGVKKKIEELKTKLPSDLKFTLIRTGAKYTYESYLASFDAFVLGTILAIGVILLFLRNLQATLIGALAIPLSTLGTFVVMGWLNYTLNFMTLLALILVIGILVDDAIVDLENIHRHIAMGKSPMVAAKEATDEIGLAVVATTLTIVAVFIPVGFMGGIPGQFFRSFGVTVSVAVLFSLVVARTLTPMMAAYMLPEHATEEEIKHTLFQRVYKKLLTLALRFRLVTTILAILIFVGSMRLVPLLPKTFFSLGDTSEASISVALPTGSTIKDTEIAVNKVRDTLLSRPEVKSIYTSIGAASQVGMNTSGGGVNKGNVSVVLVPPEKRKLTTDEFEKDVLPSLSEIPGARVSFNHFGPGGGGAKPVNIILRSGNSELLNETADKLLTDMRKLGELRDVTSSIAELRPEIVVKPDFQRAADQGVSVQSIARVARIATQGDVEVNMPKFNTGERQINIKVKLDDFVKNDLSYIQNLLVPGKNGLIPLKTVADVYTSSGPVQINRYDRERQVTISGNLNGTPLGQTMDIINKLPLMKKLPQGVTSGNLGEAEVMNNVFNETSKALVYAVLFIYAVLVLLFSGFLHPLTIMVALPLSIGGAMLGLLLWNKPLGLMSLIGVMMLLGIVTKNSILLVEYAMICEKKGMNRNDAIIEAGLTRFRPIMMTTIAMIAGMLPIAMSMGVGTEPKSPMAVAIIGGLTTSTIFTLFVIPAIYSYVDDFRNFMFRLFSRKKRKKISLDKSLAEAK